MGSTSNRFDLIRLVLASLVFVFHTVALSARESTPLEPILADLAELSIQGFFIVSGALVYGSYQRSRGLLDYASKRFRRLYPAYAVIIIVPTFVALVMAIQAPERFAQIGEYLGANLLFLNFVEPNLPGLFEVNRFSEVNGALWTLKIEVMFYLILPVIAWILARLGRFWWIGIAVLVVGAFAWRESMLALDHRYADQLARQLPGQMMYFAAGITLWRLVDVMRPHAVALFFIGAAVLALALSIPSLDALRVLGLTSLIAGIAFMPGPQLNAAAWGDVSYGVYITHFPIVQALVAFGVFSAMGPVMGLAISAVLVFAASYALWWWVERPALRADSHYRQAAEIPKRRKLGRPNRQAHAS